MTNNDVLRRVRYALQLSDQTMLTIFRLVDYPLESARLTAILKKEDEEGYGACRDPELERFLAGLIIHKRGKDEQHPIPPPSSTRITNNIVLKKLRIALELHEDDMLATFKLAKKEVTKSELTALFRKEGHKHYKACGDQILRNFLAGLTVRYRGWAE